MQTLPKHIPSIDGLRAIAIGLVLMSHATHQTAAGGPARNLLLALTENGRWGVTVFFVISGFLITTLLLREKERLGSVSLREFYIRRVFRILPAFYVYLATIRGLALLGSKELSCSSLWHALTFTTDYQLQPQWSVGHLWSLSVEEQFYLVWPVLFILCSKRVLVILTSSVIVLSPPLRMVMWVIQRGLRVHATMLHLPPPAVIDLKFTAHSRADMLMFGCLSAMVFSSPKFQAWISGLFKRRALLWASLIFFLVLSPLIELRLDQFRDLYLLSVGFTLHGCAITLLMLYAIMRPGANTITRILNHPAVTYVGIRSYSLYLWQQLFIGYRPMSVGRTAVALLGACIVAECSYRLADHEVSESLLDC